MQDKASSFLLKFLLLTHGVYFFLIGLKASGLILLFCLFIVIFSGVFSKLNTWLEKIGELLGRGLLGLVLSLLYVFVIIPLGIFNRKVKTGKSAFVKVNDSKIDFERLW